MSPARTAVTHRAVLAIALPIVLSNVTTPLLGVVDTAVIGRLGEARYIGGVALGALVFTSLYWAFGFLRMGTTGLTAQAQGAGDGLEVRAALGRALLIALAVGAAMVALQWPLGRLAFALLPGTDEVEGLARSYFRVRIWSAPFALANYALLGWFIGLAKARVALLLQVFLNSLNVVLDVAFVLGLGWGVVGIAAGTVIAEVAAAVLGLAVAARHFASLGGSWSRPALLDRARLVRTLAVNRDIFVRTLALLFGFAWFMAQSARGGEVALAVNAILLQFVSVTAFFLDGFAFAAETLVGQAIGARARGALVLAVRRSTEWAAAIAALATVVLAALGPFAIDLLSTDPEVRRLGRDYYLWAAVMPVCSVWCYQLDGIFIGATESARMRDAGLLSLGAFLALWWLLRGYGNHGLWLAFTLFMVVRALTLGWWLPALLRRAT
jgi:MATE family multidrug resistance protein